MRLPSDAVRHGPAMVVALLALTVAASLWAASMPLPMGGPNVALGALTVAAAGAYAAWRRDLSVGGPASAALAAGACLLAWAAVATWLNDEYPDHLRRLGQTAMGVGILWAVVVAASTTPRVRVVSGAIVGATFVSVAAGIGILVWGEPFVSLRSALVAGPQGEAVILDRMTGLASWTIGLAYHLSAAIPLALGLLLVPMLRPRGTRGEWAWRIAAVVVLTALATALVLNASRSALLGVFVGGLVALAPLALSRPGVRRVVSVVALMVVAVSTYAAVELIQEGAALNPRLVSVEDRSARARVPMALTALRYSLEYPLGTVEYRPEPRHLPAGLSQEVRKEVLRHTPHNQFLVVLVYYGWPGFVLLVAFYGAVARSLLASARLALRRPTSHAAVLVASLAGCVASYGVHSLFHNSGPFVSDWYHFIAVALVFCAQRALEADETLAEA